MIDAVKGNPKGIAEQVFSQNPDICQALQQGANMKDVFYAVCKQRGFNPDDILNMLK